VDDIISCIDIGTTKVCAIVANLMRTAMLKYWAGRLNRAAV